MPKRRGGGSRADCKPDPVPRPGHPGRGGGHLSRTPVARRLQRPEPEGSASSLTALLFGLAPGGVCLAGRSPGRRWALTPPFHPYRTARRCHFCGTFLRVAPTGCCPAPCSEESGLSSPPCGAAAARPPRPAVILPTSEWARTPYIPGGVSRGQVSNTLVSTDGDSLFDERSNR